MSEQNEITEREEAIIGRLEQAMTGYLGSRGPAQTVARAFDLLSALREDGVSWEHITDLVNRARQKHNQRQGLPPAEKLTTSKTICRLFNQHKDRLALTSAQPGRMHLPPPALAALVAPPKPDFPAQAAKPNSTDRDVPPAKASTNRPRDSPPTNIVNKDVLVGLQNNQDRKAKIKNIVKEDLND